MPAYDLPTSVTVGGAELAIRSDFRAALDIMRVMADPSIDDDERALLTLSIFYPDVDDIATDDLQEAAERMLWFIGGGEEPDGRRRPRVMSWEQDFKLIVAPVNKVLGYECRSTEYLHWWTFLGAYYEIGDCTFAQVVAIRNKRREGKRLDEGERKFYADNKAMVDLRTDETDEEAELFGQWIG